MGTRLKPLTCLRPKPLVPFLGVPMIDHVLNHLEKNGIKEHIVTLYHLPQMIIDYLSTKELVIDFTIEKEPRGTAGSVKEAANFLKDTFIVASGDALTDIDLRKALEYHRKKGALATIVLTRVAEPLEYGVVLTNADGTITRFLEKPTWGEVFSDTVNTGIYILEPKVLELIPNGRSYDFSKDLFPALLKANLPLFGYIAEGYWSDVGSINQYRESHWDVLTGKIAGLNPSIDDSAQIDRTALIREPVAILPKAKIGPGAKIGPFTIVGEGAVIEADASLTHTIVGNRAYLARGVISEGSIIDERAHVGEGARLLEGSIVSQNTNIGERSLLTPRVRVFPEKTVGPMSVVNTDLIHGSIERGQLFSAKGLRGKLHRDLTIEVIIKTGVAFAEVLNALSITGAADGSDKARLVKRLLSAGIMAKGSDVYDQGDTIVPSFRQSIQKSSYQGGFYVFTEGEYTVVRFFDAKGCYVDAATERKIENLVKTGDSLNPDIEPGSLFFQPNQIKDYLKQNYNLVIPKNTTGDSPATVRALDDIGSKEELGIRATISPSAENCRVWDETGHELTESELEAASLYLLLKNDPKHEPVKVPLGATSALEEIASEFGTTVQRVRPGLCFSDESNIPWHDAFKFLNIFAKDRDEPLSVILSKLPRKTKIERELHCPLEKRSEAMLKFASEFVTGDKNEAGLYYKNHGDFVYLHPDERRPVVNLTVEANSMEMADELVNRVTDLLK